MLEEKPDARQSDADRAGRELSVVLQIEEILTKLFFADIRWGFAIVLGQPLTTPTYVSWVVSAKPRSCISSIIRCLSWVMIYLLYR
jgi:hypothetical protein